jgi:hypothetical protein
VLFLVALGQRCDVCGGRAVFRRPPPTVVALPKHAGPITDAELDAATDDQLDRIAGGEPAERVLRHSREI